MGPGTAYNFDPPNPLNLPLGPKVANWAERERRVEWVLHNFSAGELAYLYKLAHDGHGVRRATCEDAIRKEAKA